MRRWTSGVLRRTAAAVLSTVMVWSLAAPAATVWAEDSAETGAGELCVSRTVSGESGPAVLRDDDTIPFFTASGDFGEFTLCRGSADAPVEKQDVSVSVISHATQQAIPSDVITVEEVSDSSAVYRFRACYGAQTSDYFGSISPEFGFDIVFTSGGETLTLHVPNDGVTVDISGMPNPGYVRRTGVEDYFLGLGTFPVTSAAMNGVEANMSWFVSEPSLTGDLAQYFTLGELTYQGLRFTLTGDLGSVPEFSTVRGTLQYTGKLDGQRHEAPIVYVNNNPDANWYQLSGEEWAPTASLRLTAWTEGSIQLRLYSSLTPPSAGGEPLAIPADALPLDLPAGITARVLEDGVTLSLEYHLTDADVRQEPYLIAISVPGVNAIYLPVEVVDAARYEVGMLSGDTYSYTDSQFNQMVTLMENYAVIPLVAGVPVSTKEELESCGLRVDDESFPGTLTQTARKIRYQDKNGDVSEVWAWCVMPTVQEADPSQTRTMQICGADGTVFGRVSYSLLGMSFSYGNDIALTADRMESRTVQTISTPGTMRYAVQDSNGGNLVLTEPPVVTGDAAQNITVVWAEGLSGVRIDFNADQVPGTVTVELRSGDTVRRVLYTFYLFEESATYYSNGVDFYRRPYNETLSLTENLASLSAGSVAPLNTTRFAEDGSFKVYVYSRQYISDRPFDTADNLGAKYSFASELVKNIEFYTSDEEILRIDSEITKTDATDPVFAGNGYANPDGKCFGITLTPGGKTGECDVYAIIELNRPSLNDPFGCNVTKTPAQVSIGYTFTVTSSDVNDTVTATPETLQQVLDSLPITPQPVIVLLEGGTYAMDLNLDGKNIILRSADAENPAVFTGAPEAQDGYIITVNAPSASFALEGIVVDGGGIRGGIRQQSTGGQPPKSFTVRECTIRNCTTGFSGTDYSNCTLRDTVIETCDLGATGCILLFCTLKNNVCAAQEEYYSNIRRSVSARWSRFAGNDLDYEIKADPAVATEYTLTLQQNYWSGKAAPAVRLVDWRTGDELSGMTLHVYASPYYTTETLDRLNIDLETTQIENGTLILPLEKSGTDEGGMLMSADAFAAIRKSGSPASFPIRDEESTQIAQWNFSTISNVSIDTDLDVDDELSEQAQSAVDKLPQADQDKILQEVNLSHNGELPGRATLRIKASEIPADGADKLCLYWVKPDGTIVPAEVVDVTYDAADGCYVITVDHCSEYVITSGELESSETTDPSEPDGGSGGSTSGNTDGNTAGTASSASSSGAAGSSSSAPVQSKLYSAQLVMDAFREQTEDVTLSVTQRSAVSQTAFELLKERSDATLYLVGKGFRWSFIGSEITDTALPGGVFEAGVTLGVEDADAERIRTFADGKAWFGFETAHSGALPGPAELQITLSDKDLAGMRCGVYWLPEDGEPEHIDTVDVAEDGTVTLRLEHCSVYFLVAEEKSEAETELPESSVQPEEPETQPQPEAQQSGILPVVIAIAVAVLAAAGMTAFILHRRKRG